jgi:SAM-dependent methyltransferase
MKIQHLPYVIDPVRQRFHFYETYWKIVSLELLARHVDVRGKTLLDYGCGRGETLQLGRDLGLDVSGTDIDPECVKLASKFGPATILNPADPVTQFGKKSFDIVSCFHVLEHVPSPLETLRHLAEIARQYVLLAVPNLRNLRYPLAREISVDMVNEGHLQAWDHWHFRSLAERHCGLELIEWGFDITVLPLISEVSQKILGTRATIALEKGLFRRLFPFYGLSIIGLFRVKAPG